MTLLSIWNVIWGKFCVTSDPVENVEMVVVIYWEGFSPLEAYQHRMIFVCLCFLWYWVCVSYGYWVCVTRRYVYSYTYRLRCFLRSIVVWTHWDHAFWRFCALIRELLQEVYNVSKQNSLAFFLLLFPWDCKVLPQGTP